jgi:hypothetical protein
MGESDGDLGDESEALSRRGACGRNRRGEAPTRAGGIGPGRAAATAARPEPDATARWLSSVWVWRVASLANGSSLLT